jgi:hypothetical protein
VKKYKSPCYHQITAALIEARGKTSMSAIHKLINSIWNKEELPDQWKESINVPVHKKGDKTDCTNYCSMHSSDTGEQKWSTMKQYISYS